jgi:hypothetical protein
MKLLLVSANDKTLEKLSPLKAAGFELICYRNALKAMDNVDEADPGGIIISARDFPRHWKTIVQFVRAEHSPDECLIALLTGGGFDSGEKRKAEHLYVNGAVSEALEETDIARLRGLFGRGASRRGAEKTPETGTADEGTAAKTRRRFGFMFTNPVSEKIITGAVTELNADGLVMEVDRSGLVQDLKAGTEISGCSLRIGEEILSPSCFIRKITGGVVSLEFSSFPENEKTAFAAWLGAET